MALENRFVTCFVKAKVSMVGVPRLSWLGCPDFLTARSQLYRGRISVSLDATPNLHFDRDLGRISFSVSLDATPNFDFDRHLGRFSFSVSLDATPNFDFDRRLGRPISNFPNFSEFLLPRM